MKNFFLPLASATTCLLAIACNKNQGISPNRSEDNVCKEICFTAGGISTEIHTKSVAVVNALEKFYVAAASGYGAEEHYAWKATEFTKKSGTDNYYGNKFWPSTNPGFHFYASNAALLCEDGKPAKINAANDTDIVYSFLSDPAYKNSNRLTFKHLFARMGSVYVKNPDGYEISSITISMTPDIKGTFDLFSGNGKTDRNGWANVEKGSSLTLATRKGNNDATDAYIIPGNYKLDATYTLTKDMYSHSFTSSAYIDIAGGSINNITATLPVPQGDDAAAEINFTVSVEPWSNIDVNATF